MSLLQGSLFVLLLLIDLSPVCSVALNLPEGYSSSDDVSNSVIPSLQNSEQLQTRASPPLANASEYASSTLSPEEQKEATLESILQHMLAKLNLDEPPQTVGDSNDTVISEALMASYHAHLLAQRQDTDAQQKCGEEKTTHFSRRPMLYYPDHYASTEPKSNRFQLYSGDDGKGEEVKDPNKDKKVNLGKSKSLPKTTTTTKGSPISPVLYNLRFDDVDFSNSNRIWSVELQLYKRKVQSEGNNKRGMNPVEAVQVFRVVRTYAYGYSTKRYVLLASKNVPSEDDGYVSFNITSGVKNWLVSDSEATSLELDIYIDTPQRVDTELSLPPTIAFDVPSERRGQHNAHILMERLNEIERIGFDDDALYRRRKRQTVRGISSEYCYNNTNETNCCIKELTVNFRDNPKFNWILYPHSFRPNYCKGQCTNLGWSYASKSTQYLIQLRNSNPTAAAEPCCVAHKTRPLTIFMRKPNGAVVLNDIPDMIVDSCICR